MNTKQRIALIGYGKMGKHIHTRMQEFGYSEAIIVDVIQGFAPIAEIQRDDVDVCLEFTKPDSAPENLKYLASRGIPTVCGTTGWLHELPGIATLVEENRTALLYAGNFSPGIHILTRLTALAAEMHEKISGYDIAVHETHHTAKVDAPSGTAMQIAEVILRHTSKKTGISLPGAYQHAEPNVLSITAARVGHVVGEHEVLLDSEVDTIRLKHTARNRRGFADGALLAAAWLQGKHGVFTIEDMFDEILST